MIKRKFKKLISAFLAATLILQMGGTDTLSMSVKADTVSGSQNANLDFESGLSGWSTTGTVTVETGGKSGEKYVKLAAGASITTTIQDISQGSYTLSAWVRGTAGNNTAKVTVSETGGPDSVALIDTYLNSDTSVWTQMGHRNVLDYNGQMTITISSGTSKLDLDGLDLALDSADNQIISNWDFENGLTDWTTGDSAAVDTGNADTGESAVRLSAGGEVSQVVSVEPNTRYSVTMRAKVDKQDTFETVKHTNYLGATGETENRTSLGDRVNLGVRTTGGTVLRQAPSGTEDYSLVTITFTTGANDHQVVIYANTVYDQNYKDSVTVYKTEGTSLADEWTGNGSDSAYVDNFDIFEIQDSNYLRGADVSFLPVIEDNGGTYYANGVQQDCLRILSNHGVNSITNMIFVQAGNQVYDPTTLKAIYHNWWLTETGEDYPMSMVSGGYFDKTHSLELGERATELGMSYLPSFHYSDYWMSNAKAYTPEEWLNTDYEGNKSNSDLAHMQSVVYNYVYDFMSDLAENNVNVAGVKHGNEQNGGIVWPVGSGATTVGHASLIAASYEAAEDAMPGVIGFVHSNNGYTPSAASTFFNGLKSNGAEMDGAAFSLYGGRSSGNILTMANYMLNQDSLKYMDYVNVETGFSFTRYKASFTQESSAMGQSTYYATSANGQYNWLLDYMQAPLDVPNPYGQTRGFYYWETDWIPTPGAESSAGGSADINARTMFNNGDTTIQEMGSSQAGKAGDMMDSMYAYLMRGCAKDKADTMQTPLKDYGTYSVKQTDPTGITLSKSSLSLQVGAEERLQPTVTPIDSVLSDTVITYTSSDSSVARVTKTGFVVAVSAGTATITATVKGGYSATVAVTVTSAVKAADSELAVTLDGNKVTDGSTQTGTVWKQLQLVASLPSTVTDQTVVYTSSNPDVASFFGETWQTPEGQMRQQTGKSTKVQLNLKTKGQTTITVASVDGGDAISFVLDTTKVDVSSVTLDKTEASISYGKTLQLNATVSPSNTTLYKVNWESSDESIATVDSKGVVTTVGIGDAVIKAVSDDNAEIFATCTVHVLPVQVESISLDKEKLTLQVGTAKTLSALILPENSDNKNITWTSGDESVATVDQKGKVTGISIGGPVTITATAENGGFKATCAVTVQEDAIAVTGITLDKSEYYFASDYFSDSNPSDTVPTYRLTATVQPDIATDTDVTWKSDTPSVATVDAYGRVTAVSGGVAKITATTKDGGFIATTNVYVPTVSESFDNRSLAETWSIAVGSVGGGAISAAVTAGNGGNVMQLTGSGSGGRSAQKKFTQAIKNNKLVVDFDWNVGAPAYSNGCYLALTDSNNKSYLSIQTNTKKELVYNVGGTPVSNTVLANTQAVGTGFNVDNTWYHVNVVLDMTASTVTFTMTSNTDSSITATHTVAFDASTSYAGDLGAIQFYGTRSSGTLSWVTQLDNVNIYKAAPVAKSISVNTDSVKIIPIEDTLGAKYQMSAQVLPDTANQNIVWTSSDETVAKVSSTGLITPAKLYTNIADIVPGSCTIKATSASDSSIYKEITVNISNSPNASEKFSVVDEKGNSVYDMGTGATNVSLQTGDKKQYSAVVTGGDGATDIAAIKWVSDNTEVVSVNADTGEVVAQGPGTANITLTVTLYTGNPLVAVIPFEVEGTVLAKTANLVQAISEAKTAKAQVDNYYDTVTLTAYKAALAQAENDLQAAVDEKWTSEKQDILDADIVALQTAVAGLKKSDVIAIDSITIGGGDTPVSINKQTTLTATFTPEYATETILWSSSDTSVAVVSKTTGTVVTVGEGTAVITASSSSGAVKATKKITVTSDLSSYYDSNGVTITSTNATRDATLAFINARTMNLAGANSGKDAWTTGSASTVGVIVADLGTKARVDNVKTAFWSLLKYTIDVSDDGVNWTTVVDHSQEAAGVLSNATAPYVDTLPENTVTRYVRLNILANGGTGWVGVTVMQINGAFVSDTDVVTDYSCASVKASLGDTLTTALLPATVAATLSSGETMDAAVTWEEDDLRIIAAQAAAGEYQVHGTIEVNGITYDVVCSLTIVGKQSIDDAVVTLEKDSYVYDGTAKEPAVTVVLNQETLTGNDYTVAYTNNTNVGTATVTISGQGNYAGTITKNFTITKPASVLLSGATIKLEKDSYVYDGTAKKPAVTVVLDGKTLTSNDYTVGYTNNTNIGTATVTVTGQGDYTGTVTKTFTITKPADVNLSKAAATLSASSYTYDGKAKKPTVKVVLDGKTLAANAYTVSYKNNTNAGTATVIITGNSASGYTGSITKTFTIKKASKTIKVSQKTISKAYGSKAFSLGASVTGKEKITYTSSNKSVVTVSSSGKVTIKGIGKATITLKSAATTNYNAAKDVKITITVKPKNVTLSSVKSKVKAQLTVSWKKDSMVSGYQVVYSTDKNFKNAKTVNVKSAKTVSKTISKLTKGKKYYVRVRAYKTIDKKTTIYGDYSSVKNVSIKK